MGRVFGERERPRVLVQGLNENSFRRLSASLQGTWRIVETLDEVRAEEWDVLVSDDERIQAPKHLYVVSLGANSIAQFPRVVEAQRTAYFTLEYAGETIAEEFRIPDGLDPRITMLVERLLLPFVREDRSNPILGERSSAFFRPPPDSWIKPWLETTEPETLAGEFKQPGSPPIWCLPPGMDSDQWVRLAFEIWHGSDPATFPSDPGWRGRSQWTMPSETSLRTELETLAKERDQFLRNAARQEEELAGRLDEEHHRVNAGERRLLTEQSAELVDAVASTLTEFGFTVTDQDATNTSGTLLEDLRLSVDGEDWSAIVEVKGGKGGATVSGLLALGRFRLLYIKETRKDASRSWYVFNQFLGQDPSARPPILESNPGELEEFARQGGLALDTSTLFELIRDLRAGSRSAEEIRSLLMTSTGRLELDSR